MCGGYTESLVCSPIIVCFSPDNSRILDEDLASKITLSPILTLGAVRSKANIPYFNEPSKHIKV